MRSRAHAAGLGPTEREKRNASVVHDDVRVYYTIYYIIICVSGVSRDRMGTASTKWISLRSFSSPPPQCRVFDLSSKKKKQPFFFFLSLSDLLRTLQLCCTCAELSSQSPPGIVQTFTHALQ